RPRTRAGDTGEQRKGAGADRGPREDVRASRRDQGGRVLRDGDVRPVLAEADPAGLDHGRLRDAGGELTARLRPRDAAGGHGASVEPGARLNGSAGRAPMGSAPAPTATWTPL